MSNPEILALKQHMLTLAQQGQFKEAKAKAKRILARAPNDKQTHLILAKIELALGNKDKAIAAFKASLGREEKHHLQAVSSIAGLSVQMEKYDQTLAFAKEWVDLQPQSSDAHYLLSFAAWKTRKLDIAEQHAFRASELDPGNLDIKATYAEICTHLGKHREARTHFEQLLDKGASARAMHRYLQSLNFDTSISDKQVFEAHQSMGEQFEKDITPRISSPAMINKGNRKLRVGFISADFRRHSVAYFFLPLIRNLDTSLFETICYADVANEDDISKKIKASASKWQSTTTLDNASLADLIQKDCVDILIDLSGHTGFAPRLEVFAMKPAPVQISYLGYPNTTGLSRIDYRIVDAITDPEGKAEALATEKLLRLSPCFLCYDALDTPEVEDLTIDETLVFGSFNAYTKITDAMVAVWAQILERVENSLLYVKAEAFVDKNAARSLHERFETLGISPDRLMVEGHKPDRNSHLLEYQRVHLHLDTAPYNGTTTTLEAAWMGVPSITLCGSSHRSRVGASLLTTLGLSHLIAQSPEEYVAIAVNEAEKLRQQGVQQRIALRDQMARSKLMDEHAFGAQFSQLLLNAYDRVGECTTT